MEIDLSKLSQFHGGLPSKNLITLQIGQTEDVEVNESITSAQTTASSALALTAVV